jgi:hypothetical protein
MDNEPLVPSLLIRLALASSAPRCGARYKRRDHPCQSPAMENGRCRLHGGASTGPRTPEGLEHSRMANWRHGYRSAEAIAIRRDATAARRDLKYLIRVFG